MKTVMKKLVQYLRLEFFWAILQISRRRGFLDQSGWLMSLRLQQSVDAKGDPIPWFTYSAVYFLTHRVKKGMRVFEYGSGLSTVWWAQHVKEVVSAEHHEGWYKKMKEILPGNASVHYIELHPNGEYSKEALRHGKFDIIVVDGRDRNNCALNSLPALKDDGVVIWDNSHRDRYQEGIRKLIKVGFKRLDFIGMSGIVDDYSMTTVFYKPKNILEI